MPKIEKEFDCVQMMRDLRDRLEREMEGMSGEERVRFINRRAERVARELGLPPAMDPRDAAARARGARHSTAAGASGPGAGA